jgi:23S rRNA pseudouridine2604 synthase
MAWTRLYDEAEPQRVNRWLAHNGVCSRREAEALILQGLVSIDGQRVDDVGRKIAPGQTLVLSDRAQAQLEGALTVMIHKPIGIVSAQPDPGQVPAVRLLTREASVRRRARSIPGFDDRLAPVGRLDKDSRGLLLLSEDGVVAKAVIGPASELEKEYLVWVDRLRSPTTSWPCCATAWSWTSRQLRPAQVEVVGRPAACASCSPRAATARFAGCASWSS